VSAVKRTTAAAATTAAASSRKQRAAATRRRILDSALTAFVTRGYSSTTMDSVAADAGVAVQTVYFAFRTKGDLLQAVYEHAVLGPEQTPPHQMPWWPRVDDGHDITEAVTRLVAGTLQLLARAAPLVWSVLGDEGAYERYEHNEQLRRFGYTELVNVLTDKHPLRPGLTPLRARDILLVLTSPQLYVQYTRDLGWNPDELAAWITTAIRHQVFGLPETVGTSSAEK
jgi:AcrR family transcriptional regulator